MSIKIIWYKDAFDFLKKSDAYISERIAKKVRDIRLNPERYVLSLVNMDVSKIRIGDYRLFVSYYRDKGELVIHSIKHRKNVYKK